MHVVLRRLLPVTYGQMIGAVALAIVLVLIGLLAAVALPGAGWILFPILVIVAILIVVRAVAGGREATPRA